MPHFVEFLRRRAGSEPVFDVGSELVVLGLVVLGFVHVMHVTMYRCTDVQ